MTGRLSIPAPSSMNASSAAGAWTSTASASPRRPRSSARPVPTAEPPGPGESGAWFLTDRVARAGESLSVLPALDGSLRQGHQALVVGYGCRGEDGLGTGRLLALSGDESNAVTIDW